MKLHASFPKTADSRRVATFEWSDGLVAETPIWSRPTKLPHDLEHYVLESYVQPPYGFWSLAAQQAPFKSLTLVSGRWPRDRVAWFERVKRKHRDEMVQAEAVGVGAVARGDLDVHRDWATIRRGFTRAYALNGESVFARLDQRDVLLLVDRHRAMHQAWAHLPMGGVLTVDWPPPPVR